MSNTVKDSPEYKKEDKWVQGFVCAVCIMIKLDGLVNTMTRETFRAGIGSMQPAQLEKIGVDESDLDIIKNNWAALYGT